MTDYLENTLFQLLKKFQGGFKITNYLHYFIIAPISTIYLCTPQGYFNKILLSVF